MIDERPSATGEAATSGTASAGVIMRQVARGCVVYHRANCHHVKGRAVEVPYSELITTMRAMAANQTRVRFDDRNLILWVCGTCEPWKVPPRPWPPADPAADGTEGF